MLNKLLKYLLPSTTLLCMLLCVLCTIIFFNGINVTQGITLYETVSNEAFLDLNTRLNIVYNATYQNIEHHSLSDTEAEKVLLASKKIITELFAQSVYDEVTAYPTVIPFNTQSVSSSSLPPYTLIPYKKIITRYHYESSTDGGGKIDLYNVFLIFYTDTYYEVTLLLDCETLLPYSVSFYGLPDIDIHNSEQSVRFASLWEGENTNHVTSIEEILNKFELINGYLPYPIESYYSELSSGICCYEFTVNKQRFYTVKRSRSDNMSFDIYLISHNILDQKVFNDQIN